MTHWNILDFFLDLLLPRSHLVRRLEAMTAENLRRAASPAEPITEPHARALFDYQNPLIRQAVWELKYRGNRKIARLLAECLYEELVEELAEKRLFQNTEKPLLVPLPLSKRRERERGFNQCDLLADILATLDGGEFFERGGQPLLVKVRDTETQTKKSRAARLENLKGCFAALPRGVANRDILLLDDVTTTGATFAEARRALRKAGARHILSVAIAH